MPNVLAGFAVLAIVLTISALASGFVERAPLSFPMIFLGIGFLLGEHGIGLLTLNVHDATLEVIAILSLTLVLFLDAVKVQVAELRQEWRIPMLALGPGTLLIIAIVAGAAVWLLQFSLVEALLLGAILASTDPVVLRDIVRDPRIPYPVRRALSVEAGMNDIVVLPIVLILIAVAHAEVTDATSWVMFLARLLLLSPLIGLAVGGGGAYLMRWVTARAPVRREYQALYGLGLVLSAYVVGQGLGSDGFLTAFAAGLAVTLFNYELCDCFLEYGETTAEITMLLAFILFGAVLSPLIATIALVPALLLGVIVIAVARPLALSLVLRRVNLSAPARAFIGWFGPRGLNSLLLGLLVVQAGIPGAEQLLAVAGVVVVLSVVAHGTSARPVSAWYGLRTAGQPQPSAADLDVLPVVTPDELATQLASLEPPVVLDVRTSAQFSRDPAQIPGSVRVVPQQLAEWVQHLPASRLVVAYCTCPDEATSGRVVRQLQSLGIPAAALRGGYAAWRARYPIEPAATVAL